MEKRHKRYLEILEKMKEYQGDLKKGETQVETDYEKILAIENQLQKDYSAKGMPAEFGNMGMVFENQWYAFLNEPVHFPGEKTKTGSYIRVLFKGEIEGEKSIFCLPILESGDFLLTVSYRTTIRNWTIEAPGTATQQGETHEEALKRCVKEKLGHELISFETLSEKGVVAERGIMGASVPVYLLKMGNEQIQKPTGTNVFSVVSVSSEKLFQGFIDGYMDIDGKRCLCQDGYTSFALLMMMLQGKLTLK